MHPSPQYVNEHEPLGKAFFGSLAAHAGVVGVVFALGYFHLTDNWGSPHASSGTVGISMVPTIPLPRNEGPVNPLANDTKSIVPQKPTPVAKPQPVVKAPEPKAIEIPDREAKPKKPTLKPTPPATYIKPETYKANQVYSTTPQAMNSPLYGMHGAGGIDIGPASVLGDRFGAYVDLMRDRITQHWNTSDVRAAPSQKCAISFVISRDGTVSNVQVAQASGSYLLDNSAKRAVLDANPLPALPAQFKGSEVPVTLWFQLRQ
jgi:TonB family protein